MEGLEDEDGEIMATMATTEDLLCVRQCIYIISPSHNNLAD